MTADGDNSRIVDHRSPGRRTSLLVVRIHRGTRMAENASCAGTCFQLAVTRGQCIPDVERLQGLHCVHGTSPTCTTNTSTTLFVLRDF